KEMLTVTKTSNDSETGFYISSLIKILTIIKQPLDCNCLIILFILTFLPQLLGKPCAVSGASDAEKDRRNGKACQ
ncbi:MAG: hypothetical protein MR567_07285, partial [Oscillospiraceae bacterium]|nr:hypothetical protein [Oscillospiraceae bacterium]